MKTDASDKKAAAIGADTARKAAGAMAPGDTMRPAAGAVSGGQPGPASLTDLPIKKIAVFRALKIGDFLVATPAFRALRAAFPQARIDYVGLPMMRMLAERYTRLFDGFVPFAGFPGLPELEWTAAGVTEFQRRMQARHYDLAIQLHGSGAVANQAVSLWGASALAGFGTGTAYWPNRRWFVEYPESLPELKRLQRLLEHCGIPLRGDDLEFPLLPADSRELETLPEYQQLGDNFVIIHPGAASSEPWPAAEFAAVADYCLERGLKIAVTGTDNEKDLVAAVCEKMQGAAVGFAGKTSLGATAALIKRGRLFIGNDTGPSHIAVAVGTPSIRIFTSSDPARWSPLDSVRHPGVLAGDATARTVIKKAAALLAHRQKKPAKPPQAQRKNIQGPEK